VGNASAKAVAIDPSSQRAYVATEGAGIAAFDAATLAGVDPPTVSQVTATSVHVAGDVDPGPVGSAGTTAHFEYLAAGETTPTSTPNQGSFRTRTTPSAWWPTTA
jgi:hypothetical protein